MMKKIILLLFIVFLNQSFSLAQDSISFEKKMKFGVQSEEYSFFYKNVFLDFKLTPLGAEYLSLSKKEFYFITQNHDINDTVMYTDKSFMFTIIGVSFEPRINLKNKENSSFYMKFPFSLNLSAAVNRKKYNKNKAFGNTNLMLLVGYAKNLNSTYTNTNHNGYAVSIGGDFYQGPFVLGKEDTLNLGYKYSDGFYEERRNFVSPVVQLDYYWLNKKYNIQGASVSVSPFNGFHLKFSLCYTISTK